MLLIIFQNCGESFIIMKFISFLNDTIYAGFTK